MVGEKVPEQPQFGIWRQIGPSGIGCTPDETAHQQLLAPQPVQKWALVRGCASILNGSTSRANLGTLGY
jgi:hypothetical protein